MFSSILAKTLYDKRWFVLGWSVGMIALVVLMIVFYPSFSQDDSLEQLFKNVPEQLKPLVGEMTEMRTIIGYVSTQLYDIRMPMLVIVMAIILVASISVAEEESGRLQQLLAQPISRARIIIEKWLAVFAISVIINLVALAAIYASLPIVNETIDIKIGIDLTIITLLMTVTLGTLTLAIAYATGHRGFTVGLASLFAVASFLLSSFGKSVKELESLQSLSIFHYYTPSEVAKIGLGAEDVAVFLGLIVAGLLIAWLGFRKRDVTA